MAITTRDMLVNALANNSDRVVIDKAALANTSGGQYFSLWTASGTPGAGSAPSAAAVCTKELTGAIWFNNPTAPVGTYLAWLSIACGNSASNLEIHDRLAHMGGLSGTSTSAQGALSLADADPGAGRIGDPNYSDLQWWLEVYSALGSTSVSATVNVTYGDDSTGNLAAITLGATPRQGRLYPLSSASPGKYIKAVNSVTLSGSTGVAGNFGITVTRPRTLVSAPVANLSATYDWAQLGLPAIENDACLTMLMCCTASSTGVIRGQGKLAHG